MFQRAFVQAGDLRIHYRAAGAGPPVVMLHPSPLSSQAVMPVAGEVARQCRVFALDTPGYGLSEPLPRRPGSLDDFLAPLAQALDALGIGRCCLYGAATGAQIALEFACRFPERTALLVMDTAGHIPAEDCDRLVDGYFPDVAPRADGSHLLTLWGLVRDLGVFFPWNDRRRAARIPRDLPPAGAMQAMLLDYLRAGVRYDWAYRPAFYNERAERVRRCPVPAILTRWPSSIALGITDALIAAGLPPNFRVLHLGPSIQDRAEGIAAAIAGAWHGSEVAPADPRQLPRDRFAGVMLDGGELQLHARVCMAGTGVPLVALHRAGGSARLLEPILAALAGLRPIVAIDLPGHGDSDPPPAPDAQLDAPVRRALESLSLPVVDVLGDGLGAEVAASLAAGWPARLRGRVMITRTGPVPVTAPPWPGLVPRLDGGHLLEAWFMLRDRRLWSPWHERTAASMIRRCDPDLDPQSLHAELVELLKCGERFAPLARREAAADVRTLSAACSGPALWLDGDPARLAAGPGAEALLPTSASAAGALVRKWLEFRPGGLE